MSRKSQMPEGTSQLDVGRRLKATRIALGLRPIALCREMGWTQSTYSTHENGFYMPSVREMIRFAERYGLSLDWIYRGKGLDQMPYGLATAILAALEETPPDDAQG